MLYQLVSKTIKSSLFISAVLLVAACSTSRYSMKHDAAPVGDFDASTVPDVVPKWEPLSRSGNKSPYTVRGKQYSILESSEGYQEDGVASWYGLKFHGELTSNGEVYNMYALSAAHKSLPLPSYLRVTNLENGRNIIVRVNDRGPFHSDRIVDLSYAAAKKLGFQKKGTAKVHLEAIVVPPTSKVETAQGPDKLASFVQIAAFTSEESVNKVNAQIKSKLTSAGHASDKLYVAKSPDRDPPVYRLRMGPYANASDATKVLKQIEKLGISGAQLITRSIKAKHH